MSRSVASASPCSHAAAALRAVTRLLSGGSLPDALVHVARELMGGDGVAVMDDGRIVHRGRMADLAADAALQTRLLGLSLEAHR